jgi:hypothetical protein
MLFISENPIFQKYNSNLYNLENIPIIFIYFDFTGDKFCLNTGGGERLFIAVAITNLK